MFDLLERFLASALAEFPVPQLVGAAVRHEQAAASRLRPRAVEAGGARGAQRSYTRPRADRARA
jgi:hypothetical protein